MIKSSSHFLSTLISASSNSLNLMYSNIQKRLIEQVDHEENQLENKELNSFKSITSSFTKFLHIALLMPFTPLILRQKKAQAKNNEKKNKLSIRPPRYINMKKKVIKPYSEIYSKSKV